MSNQIGKAVEILRAGGLVAFPTETVYGLGADATNSAAVSRIFQAKGRPATNPLIVHIAGIEQALRYSATWPAMAQVLAKRFWPGPLTIVLPRATVIVPEVSAGLNTVGLRCPRHPLALELLAAFDGAIAAPSANRSNRISPTTAQHVRDDLQDRVDLVLDGGPCEVGIESTVLSLCTPVPTIFRPGGISRDQLLQVIPEVQVSQGVVSAQAAAASPGQHAIHYSPRTPCFHYTETARASQYLGARAHEKVIVICLTPVPGSTAHRRVTMPGEPESYARHLYAALHAADQQDASAILIEMPPDEPQWIAVRDRLLRAARPLP